MTFADLDKKLLEAANNQINLEKNNKNKQKKESTDVSSNGPQQSR